MRGDVAEAQGRPRTTSRVIFEEQLDERTGRVGVAAGEVERDCVDVGRHGLGGVPACDEGGGEHAGTCADVCDPRDGRVRQGGLEQQGCAVIDTLSCEDAPSGGQGKVCAVERDRDRHRFGHGSRLWELAAHPHLSPALLDVELPATPLEDAADTCGSTLHRGAPYRGGGTRLAEPSACHPLQQLDEAVPAPRWGRDEDVLGRRTRASAKQLVDGHRPVALLLGCPQLEEIQGDESIVLLERAHVADNPPTVAHVSPPAGPEMMPGSPGSRNERIDPRMGPRIRWAGPSQSYRGSPIPVTGTDGAPADETDAAPGRCHGGSAILCNRAGAG